MEECHLLLTDQVDLEEDLDYLVSGIKERRSTLSISKLKAANYLNFRLEELVPSLWIEYERDYDISAAYGISHWWFKRKEFYITRHSAPSDRSKVRSHMRILSVVSLKTLERYGYTYLKRLFFAELTTRNTRSRKLTSKICILMILKTCIYFIFKVSSIIYLVPTKFISLTQSTCIVIKKRIEDLQLGIESFQTKLNLTQLDWDASDFIFKEDYTIVTKPRAVIYRDKND
ncbi:hypothetical protein Tco_1336656 [Tanacetum coccineum]